MRRNTHGTYLVPVLVGFAASAARAAAVVVLPAVGPGLVGPALDDIANAVRAGLEAQGFDVQDTETTQAVVNDAWAGGLSCNTLELGCQARLGAIADAKEAVAVVVAPGGALLTLVRLDVARKAAVTMAADVVRSTNEDEGRSVGLVARRLMRPPATLELDVKQRGAAVFVDGVHVGDAPLPAPLALDARAHTLRVALEGYTAVERRFTVATGEHAMQPIALEGVRPASPAVADAPGPTGARTGMGSGTAPQAAPDAAHKGSGVGPSAAAADGARGDGRAGGGPQPLFVAGAVTAGAGALIAAAGGIGALLVEAGLDTPKPGADSTEAGRRLGLALVVTAAAGVVVAGVGGTLIAVSP